MQAQTQTSAHGTFPAPPKASPVDDDAGHRLADRYLRMAYELGLDAVLALPDADRTCNEDLRGSPLYREIQEARRAEDPRLPLGPWERELKRADWPKAGRLCVHALAGRSKDLQLAAWLMEAGLQLHGFGALAPGLALLRALCEVHWEALHPLLHDGDLEYRTNIFRWIDSKFPAAIAMLPLATSQQADDDLPTLGGWRRTNMPDADGKRDRGLQDQFLATLGAIHGAELRERIQHLASADDELGRLNAVLDHRCGSEAPGFTDLRSVLDEIQTLLKIELERRGDDIPPQAENEALPLSSQPISHPPGETSLKRGAAYALLSQAVETLLHTDPHSPVPYLLRVAIAWGRMDARTLYEDLFINNGGQINVFQLLGLDYPEKKG